MLLAIDIGNSDITLGLGDGDSWPHVWRIPTVADLPQMYYSMRLANNFLENGIGQERVKRVAISSVVPELTSKLEEVSLSLFGITPLILGPEVFSKLPLKLRSPYEIGADLVCNAMAAFTRFKQNCVVIDFGTALTFTAISGAGEIRGVAIAPGLKTAIRSLSQHTAKLFDVPIEMPSSALGRGTTHAIQAGVMIGYEGMVIHMIDRLKREMDDPGLKTIATGGLCMSIPSLKILFTEIDPNLTLSGLRIITNYF